ncbi:MAG TPA: gluconokinase [Nitrospiraceae bacterium]|nr:gluconokinase [Nitrospiraceae bacterium]
MRRDPDMIIIVMGVSGSGKTTIGTQLAKSLHWTFVDADDFHLAANVDKMRRGIPLTEEDRRPWLAALRAQIGQWLEQNRSIVLACSALKGWYRRALLIDPSRMRLVYLKGSYSLIAERLARRQGHFMRRELLASQYGALEEPAEALIVDAALRPPEIVQEIRKELNL